MNTVRIDIEIDQARDTTNVFVCSVSDDYAESGEFDFIAPKDFLSQSEEEIFELILRHDDEAADILEAALTNESPVVLNGGDMSLDSLKAAFAACARDTKP